MLEFLLIIHLTALLVFCLLVVRMLSRLMTLLLIVHLSYHESSNRARPFHSYMSIYQLRLGVIAFGFVFQILNICRRSYTRSCRCLYNNWMDISIIPIIYKHAITMLVSFLVF